MSILFFTSCNSQKREKQVVKNCVIEKMTFSEVNVSEPITNDLYEKKIIEYSLDSVSLITKIYKRDVLVKSDKAKSHFNSNEELFSGIPEKYLTSKSFNYLNYYPENDEEYINVDIYMNNGKTINWTLSNEENDLPQELKLVYKNFIISKKRLL